MSDIIANVQGEALGQSLKYPAPERIQHFPE